MKRFWLVLLSLGLIVAFSTSAMAVDVKFSGEYFIGGMYLDKVSLNKAEGVAGNQSTAFYFQRLRVRTDFVVSPGLTLVTRFDAMERVWGAPRTTPGLSVSDISADRTTERLLGSTMYTQPSTLAEAENIAFQWAYINYASPIGIFTAGYQNDNVWGTIFGDSAVPAAKITYTYVAMPIIVALGIIKPLDTSQTAKRSAVGSDTDIDLYTAAVIYNGKGFQAGLAAKYYAAHYNRSNQMSTDIIPAGVVYAQTNAFALAPYAKMQLGPVAIQAEAAYFWGDYLKYEAPSTTNVQADQLSVYVDALANFNMAYVGATVAYVSGDKINSSGGGSGPNDKSEGGLVNGGTDWNPCLIMWNQDRNYWAGGLYGAKAASSYWNYPSNPYGMDRPMLNAYFGQVRGGVKPIDKLDIGASIAFAVADQKPLTAWVKHEYGWEVDVSATYKITNNLSYMLGFGYLFTGDFFKGTDPSATVRDEYLVINKLTLTF